MPVKAKVTNTKVAKKPAAKADKKSDFDSAFRELRKILKPYDKKLLVLKDGPAEYMSQPKSIRYMGKPLMFASITIKSYVSFHLFPVYMFPDLLKGISPILKKRMQGKACFNFKKVEEDVYEDLGKLVKKCFQRFAKFGERDLTREDAQALWGKGQSK